MVLPEQDARFAAETLLHSNSYQQNLPNLDLSHSQSINTIPSIHQDYIVSEDIVSGQRYEGRMSNVRRFFCLFVTFDLLFTSLLWLTCVMLNGEDISTALNKQIYHYNIHTSLFDIVLAAICRFTVLLLFYAVLYVNHWFVISLSTACTCAFLITKVFLYNWPASQQPVFEVLLVLISFVLSWGEAWFLDFRVLPQESHARRYLISSPDSERAPLIRSYLQGVPSMYTESVGNFYSPLQSPEGSLYRFDSPGTRNHAAAQCTKELEEEYRVKGKLTFIDSLSLLNHPDWKAEKQNTENDTVYTLTLPKIGKIFKLIAEMEVSPRCLLDELFYRVEFIPKWNPTLLESHKIQSLDENTDISYQVSADAAGGIVKSRDFVTLRHWDVKDDTYVIACIGTEHPSLPKNEKYTRGENGISCLAMSPITDEPNKCQFHWVLNTNLKGWIPPYILDTAFINMMFDYVKHLRQHVSSLKDVN